MELTDRKKRVLRSVVDLYIRTAEPVGSKAITALPDLNYSSATIRNEMADLTAMGYLEQPHTSAGRIPSAAGYRLYVDELMQDYRLSIDETKSINQALEEKMQKVDRVMEQVAKLVSQATDLPAITVASHRGGCTVKRFDLIQAGAGSFILVVMLSNEEVTNKLIKLPLNVGENQLRVLGAVLNATMTDLELESFTPELMDKVLRSAGEAATLVPVIVEFVMLASHRGGCTVKRFDLIQAGAGSFILVVMLSNEEVTNKLIKLPLNVGENQLRVLGAVLNATMTDLELESFTPELMDKVLRSAGEAATLVPVIVEFVMQTLKQQREADVRVAGQMRLLGQPEYRDVEKAQKVLSTLDEEMITNLPSVMSDNRGTKVLVGPEHVASELKDTSVVMTKFDIGDGMQGMIGVVGPTRMDYAKVTARLSYMAENLSRLFAKPETEPKTLPSGGEPPADPGETHKEES